MKVTLVLLAYGRRVGSCAQVDNREVLNCYYAHADQADQLQVSPVSLRPAHLSLPRVSCKPHNKPYDMHQERKPR